ATPGAEVTHRGGAWFMASGMQTVIYPVKDLESESESESRGQMCGHIAERTVLSAHGYHGDDRRDRSPARGAAGPRSYRAVSSGRRDCHRVVIRLHGNSISEAPSPVPLSATSRMARSPASC